MQLISNKFPLYIAGLAVTAGVALATTASPATVSAVDTSSPSPTITNSAGGQTPVPGTVIQPSANPTPAPLVTPDPTPAPAPSATPVPSAVPTPAVKTVVNVQRNVNLLNKDDNYCLVTYDDGSTSKEGIDCAAKAGDRVPK